MPQFTKLSEDSQVREHWTLVPHIYLCLCILFELIQPCLNSTCLFITISHCLHPQHAYYNLAASQDSVRLLSVDNCVKIAALLDDTEKMRCIVPVVKQCAEDKSWRVRYCAAEKMAVLADCLGSTITNNELISLFVRLLKVCSTWLAAVLTCQ